MLSLDLPGLSLAAPTQAPPTPSGSPSIARVLLEDSTLELDYLIPPELGSGIVIGARVIVPVQNRSQQAIVTDLLHSSPHQAKLKPIIKQLGSTPMFSAAMLKLAHWISAYYLTPVRQVLRTMLPEAVRNRPETFINETILTLDKPWDDDATEKLAKRSPNQAQLLRLIHQFGGTAPLSQLRKQLPTATTLSKALIHNGWLTATQQRKHRDPTQNEDFVPSQPHTLTAEQTSVLEAITRAMLNPPDATPILLHGVTGSGKPEIYLQTIAKIINQGKTALILVPEISLTPQTIERFKARFAATKDRIAILHSHLSDGERHDEWFKIHEQKADVVIGARSAIFAPLPRLGIIIVDEEHEPSYKQEENPRYQARDVAVVRAGIEGCLVLLGSATPSLESFENACRGKYQLLRMTQRTDAKKLPLVRIIDMRLARRKGTGIKAADAGCISEKLRHAITDRLEKGQQTILFINP